MQPVVALPDHGPFDIIGDVHGCLDELIELLEKLDYAVESDSAGGFSVTAPAERRVIFLGDLVNRGPDPVGVLRLAMAMVEAGQALCLRGNHDEYVRLRMRGFEVTGVARTDTIDLTVSRLEDAGFAEQALEFIESLPWRIRLDEGRLLLAHAGLPQEYHGIESDEARDFAINGSKTAQIDEYGRGRTDGWSSTYQGVPMVVYGHHAQAELRWLNKTICLDTGCVYGGRLTALRYPERRLVSVVASRVYYETKRSAFMRATAMAAAASEAALTPATSTGRGGS